MADVSDAPENQGVMIAFLPTTSDWCDIELPHLTLVYAGTKDKLHPGDFNRLGKDASSISMLLRPFMLQVSGVDVFGEEEKVNVLRYKTTPELMAVRQFVESWNASEHPFNPHSTIGPAENSIRFVPDVVVFDRVMVGWGDESLVFKL